MLGYAADLAFYHVTDKPHITGLNWRLMLGSAGFPALIVMAQMPFLPESPRWLMSKGRYEKAFKSMVRLRGDELLAARDIYYIFVLLQEEASIIRGRNRFLDIFAVARNRRAALASTIVMFGQQFCGVRQELRLGTDNRSTLSSTTPLQSLLKLGLVKFRPSSPRGALAWST